MPRTAKLESVAGQGSAKDASLSKFSKGGEGGRKRGCIVILFVSGNAKKYSCSSTS